MKFLQILTQKTINFIDSSSYTIEKSVSLFDLAVKGGWIMLILLLLSILTIYIFIDRFIAIKKAGKFENKFMENIRNFILDGKIENALALCNTNDSPFTRMIEKGIRRLGRPLNDINTAIENVGQLEIENLKKGLPFLGTIAAVAPMIGFLGTVTGMVKAFYNMSLAGNNVDISLLANGIYEAMITTIGGLIVGIIALLAYNYLISQIERLVYHLQATATEFMDILNEPIK